MNQTETISIGQEAERDDQDRTQQNNNTTTDRTARPRSRPRSLAPRRLMRAEDLASIQSRLVGNPAAPLTVPERQHLVAEVAYLRGVIYGWYQADRRQPSGDSLTTFAEYDQILGEIGAALDADPAPTPQPPPASHPEHPYTAALVTLKDGTSTRGWWNGHHWFVDKKATDDVVAWAPWQEAK